MRDLDLHALDLSLRQRLVGSQLRQVELRRDSPCRQGASRPRIPPCAAAAAPWLRPAARRDRTRPARRSGRPCAPARLPRPESRPRGRWSRLAPRPRGRPPSVHAARWCAAAARLRGRDLDADDLSRLGRRRLGGRVRPVRRRQRRRCPWPACGSDSCAASALTAGLDLVGSLGLNSMPEASQPAASSAMVPAIKYERRMVRSSLRWSRPNGLPIQRRNEQVPAPDRRSSVQFSAQSWVKGRERVVSLVICGRDGPAGSARSPSTYHAPSETGSGPSASTGLTGRAG